MFAPLTDHPLSSATPSRWPADAAPLVISILLAAFAAWLSLVWMTSNVDVSWLLVVGDRLLDGARLHHDIIEANPPFSVWLYMPLLVVERATGIRAEAWLAIGLPMLALLSVLVSARILRRAGWFEQAWTVWLLPAAVWIMAYLFPGDFGQREQIASIALLPWLALLAAREQSPDFRAGTWLETIVAGIGAAIFVMVKPPLAVLSLALPALWIATSRRSVKPLLTPETLIGAAITLVYVGWLALFHQDYFATVVPLLGDLYMPIRLPIVQALGHWPVIAFGALACATLMLGFHGSVDGVSRALLLAALGYLPGVILMGKSWTYQAIPLLLFGLLALLVQAVRPGLAPMMRRTAILAAAVLAGSFFAQSIPRLELSAPRVDDILRHTGPHPTIMTIAGRLQPAHPLTREVGGRYLSRLPSLWTVQNAEILAARETDPQRRAALLETRNRGIAEAASEIVREKPDVVIAGGTRPAPGEVATMADAAVIAALKSYRPLYQDAGRTVFIRDGSPAR